MPAAYETGISSSPTNLLQSLVSWLTAQGWTLDLEPGRRLGVAGAPAQVRPLP